MTANLPAVVTAALPAAVRPLIRWESTSVYGADGQFDAVVVSGAKIGPGATVADLTAALAAVERSLLPAGRGDVVVQALAPMYATRRNRPGEQVDEQAAMSVLVGKLRETPRDVIEEAGNHFIETTPWMPAVSEFLQVVDRKMRPRRALKAALEQAIERASAPSRPQLEAPKPLPTLQERLRTSVLLRRQASDDRTAAHFEVKLAGIEKRPVAKWAEEAIALQIAEQRAKAEEYQRLAEEEAAKEPLQTPSEGDQLLAELAQRRRDHLLGIDRGEVAA